MATESGPRDQHSHSSKGTGGPGPVPPTPSFIFRGHDAPVHAVEFFALNTFLVTGDEAGWICVWDIWKRRPVHRWHGHPFGSILALKAIPFYSKSDITVRNKNKERNATKRRRNGANTAQSEGRDWTYIVSHGRDNEIHVWDISFILQQSLLRLGASMIQGSSSSSKQSMVPLFSLPVNALNFCKMSVLAIESAPHLQQKTEQQPLQGKIQEHDQDSSSTQADGSLLRRTHRHIYIAVPSPTTPTLIDVYDIVKPERTFASIGGNSNTSSSVSGETVKKWGSVMAIQLFQTRVRTLDHSTVGLDSDESTATGSDALETLHMLVGYEDGSVALFQKSSPSISAAGQKTSSGSTKKRMMDVIWTCKSHREPVLALDISPDLKYAVSCGSDNVLAKYDLDGSLQGVPEVTQVALKANGIADIKIRSDNKIIGLAGWDGRIRVYSAKTLKPLAVLKHHRESLYCLAFAAVNSVESAAAGTDADVSSGEYDGKQPLETRDGGHAEKKEDGSDAWSDSGSDSESEEEDNSDLEDALEERRRWSRRHWIAVGGKENRVSLWELY